MQQFCKSKERTFAPNICNTHRQHSAQFLLFHYRNKRNIYTWHMPYIYESCQIRYSCSPYFDIYFLLISVSIFHIPNRIAMASLHINICVCLCIFFYKKKKEKKFNLFTWNFMYFKCFQYLYVYVRLFSALYKLQHMYIDMYSVHIYLMENEWRNY